MRSFLSSIDVEILASEQVVALAGANAVLGFIERHLNISFDDGDGTFEMLILVQVIILIACIGTYVFNRHKSKRDAS